MELCDLLRDIEDMANNSAESQALELLADKTILEFEKVSMIIKDHIAKII